MDNFDIVNLNEANIKILIVMKVCDSPFDFGDEIKEQLKEIGFSGEILIDELLHSGNNEERFIRGFFDGKEFDKSEFKFANIEKDNEIRNYICEYLKSDLEILKYSSLTERQQKLISHGCVI